jgi:hypothetical protein
MHYIRLLTIYQPSLIIFSAVAVPGSGEVLELADRRDLGSRAARRTGSTPVFPTSLRRFFPPCDRPNLAKTSAVLVYFYLTHVLHASYTRML